ncbi:MAG: adenylate cyclase [Myxococcota bacterium]|jgi:adenylate cyclase
MSEVLINQAPPPDTSADGGTIVVTARGPAIPRSRAWRMLGDTDWMNRVSGGASVLEQSVSLQKDGLPAIVGNIAGPMGMKLPFEEVWTSWAAGQYFRQVRDVHSPLLRRTDYHARLHTTGDLVEPEITLQVTVPAALKSIISMFQVSAIQRKWQRLLDALGEGQTPVRTLPDAARVALDRWETRTEPGIVASFREHLLTASPTELQRLRGFALADQWGRPRAEVLDAMLHGVEAGALELYWSVRCTRCLGQVAVSESLSDLADHADCPACRIGFETDLGANVEVLFSPHPGLVPRIEEQFCTLYPAASPDLFGVFTLAPDQQLQQTIDLPAGRWRLGSGGEKPDLMLESEHSGADAVDWRQSDPKGTRVIAPGPVQLHLHNDSDSRRRVYLIGTKTDDRIPASYLTSHPGFRDRMSHQVLAPDLRISVRSVVLLFTDLSGSTAMYEELGDARAFAVVRDHFVILKAAVAECGGVVVKTIGDAVMASFHDTTDAMRCALQMQEALTPWAGGLGLIVPPRLKIGIHVGSALAVHSDASGLDYFGGSVNLAARAESAAEGGQIVWTQSVQDDPRIPELLAASGRTVEAMERELKGLKGATRLYRLII